ncbi:MAG TPA: pentapeptide repeat-containing protein [Ilumatobacter sp.]|nr:pentapeptide repeat-containing protein [Ilumatobacter sp.]
MPVPGGAYLAVARRQTSCHGATPDDLQVAVCTRRRPVAYTSPDALTWTETVPAAWAPPSNGSLRIDSVIATDAGLLAAGTILGPQWRAVLYSSPDGTNWTTERELTNAGNPLTSVELVHDGTTLTYIAHETACDTSFDSPGGWVLGSFWARHGRIFTGTDIASLRLQEPGEHPLAPAPLEPLPDCGSIDGVPYAAVPYPQFRAQLVGGVTTIFEDFVPPEQVELVEQAADDEVADVRATSGTRRYAQLVDGAWSVTEIDSVSVPETVLFFDYPGTPAFAEVDAGNLSIQPVFSIIGGTQMRSTIHPLANAAVDVTAVGDTLMVLSAEVADPSGRANQATPTRIVLWRSEPGAGSTAPGCDLRAGGVCRFFDLTTRPDYPDFAGRDLAGVHLVATNLGSANFDGANLAGAQVWLAESDDAEPPSFVGADLTGSRFNQVRLGDLSGATVDGANFRDARIGQARGVDVSGAVVTGVRIDDITDVTFGRADLSGATLIVAERFLDLASLTYDRINIRVEPAPGATFELDLTDADLTGLRLSGPLASGSDTSRYIVVTSLTGAIFDNTTFSEVDLSRVDDTIDLSELEVRTDTTICPDGLPPDGTSFFGTCTRAD